MEYVSCVSKCSSARFLALGRSQLDCHPERAFLARRRIWASRAKHRVLCDAMVARLARFLIKLTRHPERRQVVGSAILRLSLSPSRTKLVRCPASRVFPGVQMGCTI